MNKELKRQAAQEIARQARIGVREIPGIDDTDLDKIAERVTTQDPWWRSKRVHAAGAAVLALVLGSFGVDWEQAQLVELFGAAAALVSVVLPLLSKVSDVRTTGR